MISIIAPIRAYEINDDGGTARKALRLVVISLEESVG